MNKNKNMGDDISRDMRKLLKQELNSGEYTVHFDRPDKKREFRAVSRIDNTELVRMIQFNDGVFKMEVLSQEVFYSLVGMSNNVRAVWKEMERLSHKQIDRRQIAMEALRARAFQRGRKK